MLESLLQPKKARDNPLELLIVSMVIASVSIIFSYFIFPEYSSVLSSAFITIVFTPFFMSLFTSEEAKEEFAIKHHIKKSLFQRHAPVLKIYSAYFMGLVLIMSMMFVFLPVDMRTVMFSKQISEVKRLSGLEITGSFISLSDSQKIFTNNMFVLLLSFIASLLFGTGALFILSWNASVIGVYVGTYVNYFISNGMAPAIAYAYGMPQAILAITLHGIPEVFGYFFAGLAGGILSVGVIKEKMWSKEMEIIVIDSLIILSIGIFSIFVGAFIETGNILLSSIGFISYVIFIATLFFHGKG